MNGDNLKSIKEKWQKFEERQKKNWKEEPRLGFLVCPLIVLVSTFLLWMCFPLYHNEGMIKVTPVANISIFAIFYLFGQLIERIVEFFSRCDIVFVDPREIKDEKDDILKENMKTRRKNRLWTFSSCLGVIFTYFSVGLFGLVGISIWRFLDSLFSGIIIGGGTKPLHDLITYLEKQKK